MYTGNFFKLDEVAYRKDAKAECTEVKFSPSNDMVGRVGSHLNLSFFLSFSFSVLGYAIQSVSADRCGVAGRQHIHLQL